MSDEKSLSDDLNEKLGDAKESVKKAVDKVEDFADDAKEKAKDFAKEAKESTKEFADDVKDTTNEFVNNAKETFSGNSTDNKKVLAGLLGIFLGGLGAHKFILGYTKEGGILLGVTLLSILLSCIGIGLFFVWIPGTIGLIEGIIYLTKSDDDFYQTYQVGKKPWF
ncbi:MAG: NINE protein [Flavobacteriaceae bacterium]